MFSTLCEKFVKKHLFSICFRSRNESFVLSDNEWPRCIEDTTSQTSNGNRKKRFVKYEGLRADISYSLNVFFETQWMYTFDLETDILDEKNVSFTNTLFPKTVIEVFHERIESVLGIIHKWSHPIWGIKVDIQIG